MDLYTHEGDIPIPRPIKYEGADAQSLGNSNNIQDSPPFHPSNGSLPLPPLSRSNTEHQNIIPYTSKKERVFRYFECLKNHAAARGRHATDGCGEFMPSGEEGSLEALNCSACGCHRNFHRRVMEGEEAAAAAAAATYECYHHHHHHHHLKRRNVASHKGVLIAAGHGLITRAPPHPMVMPLVSMQAADMQGVGGGLMARPPIVKKRFRTKFTPDQKEKMLAFAEKLGWRLHKEEEGIVQQFCQEVGVRRKVLKVWMHNNKHILAKDKPHPQLE